MCCGSTSASVKSSALAAKLAFQSRTIRLGAAVPTVIVERTIRIQVVLAERAVDKGTLDELTAGEARATKIASVESDANANSAIKQSPIPFTIFERATDKDRIDVSAFGADYSEVAITEDMIRPRCRFLKACIKLLQLKEHGVYAS